MAIKLPILFAVSTIAFSISTYSHAKSLKTIEAKPLAFEQLQGTRVDFSSKKSMTNATLSVAGPNGFHASVFSKKGIPSLDIQDFGSLDDGVYNYEIKAAGHEIIKIRDSLNNGRGDNASTFVNKSLSQSGHFRVLNGQIAHFDDTDEQQSRMDQ